MSEQQKSDIDPTAERVSDSPDLMDAYEQARRKALELMERGIRMGNVPFNREECHDRHRRSES